MPHPRCRSALSVSYIAMTIAATSLLLGERSWAQAAGASVTLETLSVAGDGSGVTRGESAYGPVRGYVATRSAAGTKTDTPLKETPQSISVVGEEQVRDQGATSIQEALRYTAGVNADAYGPSTRGNYSILRGSTADIYLDGLRLTDPGQFNEAQSDPYTLSRFEVLRGPASTLYGSTPTSGLINLVSKLPQDVPFSEVGLRFGSFNRKEALVDTTGRLTDDGRLLYRFVGVGRLADSQTDRVPADRYVINPSITWRPDASTTWTVIGLHQKDAFGASDNFLPREGALFPGPNGLLPLGRFTGDPSFNKYETVTSSVTSLFEHRFSDAFVVRQNLRYSHIEGTYQSAYGNVYDFSASNPYAPFLDAARQTVNRFTYGRNTVKDRITSDTNAQARFETGPISHTVLGGVDVRQYYERASSGFGVDPRPFNLYDPVYVAVPRPDLTAEPELAQNQTGLYLQDQLKVGSWILLASVRHDFVSSGSKGSATQRNEATTGRVGLMYAFENGFSPYVSYATSFTPVFGGGTCASGTCQPIAGEQVEGGVKYTPLPWLAVNASIYDTIERNRLTPDPSNPIFQIQTGRAHIQGGEIEALATMGGSTDIVAAYAYTDARVLAGTNAGARIESVPLHQASLWVKHRFSLFGVPGFIAGGGVRYIGESFDGSVASLNTPAATLADAMIGWEDAHWRAQLNVTNLADTRYLATCLARGDCFVGNRRTVLGTLTYRF